MMSDESRYEALAAYAETDMEPGDARTVLHGQDAAAEGREMLARAGVGRPKLDPSGEKGERAPKRQVRVSKQMSDAIDALATERGEHPSVIMREAFEAYLSQASRQREHAAAS